MSKMKKLLACLLAAALVTTSVVPVFATSGGPEDDPSTPTVGADSWDTENAPEQSKVELDSEDNTATLGSVESEKEKVEVSGEVTVGDKSYVVTAIEKNSFSGCKNATEITVGVSPKAETYTIQKNAFLGCSGVKIVLNAKNFSGWTIKKGAFGKHSGGKTVELKRPNGKSYTAKQRKKIRKLLRNAGFNGKIKF